MLFPEIISRYSQHDPGYPWTLNTSAISPAFGKNSYSVKVLMSYMAEVFGCIQTLVEVFISAKRSLAEVFGCIQNLVEVFISATRSLGEVFE